MSMMKNLSNDSLELKIELFENELIRRDLEKINDYLKNNKEKDFNKVLSMMNKRTFMWLIMIVFTEEELCDFIKLNPLSELFKIFEEEM